MNLLVRRFLSVIAPLTIGILVILGNFNASALAQNPPRFKISVVPQLEYAVINYPFTYTVTVTNVSQMPLNNTFVTLDIPTGTKFINTQHASLKWYGGNAFPDPSIKIEQISLYSLENIEPGETFEFKMLVEVLPEAGRQIVVEGYDVTTLDGDTLATGLPVKTRVLALAPSPTPLPSLSPIDTPAPTKLATTVSPTSVSQTMDNITTATPLAITSAQADSDSTNVDSPALVPSTNNQALEIPSWPIIILVAISPILILAAVSAAWYLKKK